MLNDTLLSVLPAQYIIFAISVRSKLNTLDFRYFFGCFHFHYVGVIMVVTEYTYVLSI